MSHDDRPVIKNKVAGDAWVVRLTVVDIPTGQTITEAWFTVKENIQDTDAAAIVQKHILPIEAIGQGLIENTGSSGTGIIRFNLLEADTLLFKPYVTYEWDAQIKVSSVGINTPKYARGTLIAESQVTISV